MSITELLQAVDRLNEPDLDQLLDRVLLLRQNIDTSKSVDLGYPQGAPLHN